jgi:hypothetical protein
MVAMIIFLEGNFIVINVHNWKGENYYIFYLFVQDLSEKISNCHPFLKEKSCRVIQ